LKVVFLEELLIEARNDVVQRRAFVRTRGPALFDEADHGRRNLGRNGGSFAFVEVLAQLIEGNVGEGDSPRHEFPQDNSK
jgi:hypothetical protein